MVASVDGAGISLDTWRLQLLRCNSSILLRTEREQVMPTSTAISLKVFQLGVPFHHGADQMQTDNVNTLCLWPSWLANSWLAHIVLLSQLALHLDALIKCPCSCCLAPKKCLTVGSLNVLYYTTFF